MKKATATKTKTTPATPAPVPEKKVKSPVTAKAAPVKPKAKTPSAAPAVKASSSASVLTTISAVIDIGFGNKLWLRGEGPGLSWEKGVVMDCVADDKWSLTIPDASAPIVFKFLVNDLSWSTGTDYVAKPGESISLTPTF